MMANSPSDRELMASAPLASADEWDDIDACPVENEAEDNVECRDIRSLDEQLLSTDQHTASLSSEESTGCLIGGSLEDLVNHFDDTINHCFCNFKQKTSKIAPVPKRKKEELVGNSSMWWTITGNYGDMLPIDWSKMLPKELHEQMLEETKTYHPDELQELSDDDLFAGQERSASRSSTDELDADHVIGEITRMMEDPNEMQDSGLGLLTASEEACVASCSLTRSDSTLLLRQQELEALSEAELEQSRSALTPELGAVQATLCAQLAAHQALRCRRDQLQHFLALVLQAERARQSRPAADTEHVTTVIPYQPTEGAPCSDVMEIYIELLQGMLDNSSSVPSLLTNYILKVLCPTTV